MEQSTVEKKQKLKEAVLGSLSLGRKSQKDIQIELNSKPASVNQVLKKLTLEGKISREKLEVNGKKVFQYLVIS